jgi:hypothetical protein
MNIVDRIKKGVTELIISSGDTALQNILLKEMLRRRGRRRKQLLDYLKANRRY